MDVSASNPPRFCPAGHRLGPNRVLVDAPACACGKGSTGHHYRWKCRVCGACIYSDGHVDNGALMLPESPLIESSRIDA